MLLDALPGVGCAGEQIDLEFSRFRDLCDRGLARALTETEHAKKLAEERCDGDNR